MRAYRDTQLIFVFLIVAYTIISCFAPIDDRELFPFFNWSLFTNVPTDRYDYGIRILAIGDKTLPEPLYLEEAGKWLFPEPSYLEEAGKTRSVLKYRTVDDITHRAIEIFGKAAKGEGKEGMASARRGFERCLGRFERCLEEQVRYELVHRKFSLSCRFRKGEFIWEKVLGEFKEGEKSPLYSDNYFSRLTTIKSTG